MSFQTFFRRHWPDRDAHGRAPTPTAIAAAQLKGIAEDEDRLPPRPGQWLVLMLLAAIVGALAGLVGSAFRYSLTELDVARTHLLVWTHVDRWLWIGWACR